MQLKSSSSQLLGAHLSSWRSCGPSWRAWNVRCRPRSHWSQSRHSASRNRIQAWLRRNKTLLLTASKACKRPEDARVGRPHSAACRTPGNRCWRNHSFPSVSAGRRMLPVRAMAGRTEQHQHHDSGRGTHVSWSFRSGAQHRICHASLMRRSKAGTGRSSPTPLVRADRAVPV